MLWNMRAISKNASDFGGASKPVRWSQFFKTSTDNVPDSQMMERVGGYFQALGGGGRMVWVE
jgi:hypothetical protein